MWSGWSIASPGSCAGPPGPSPSWSSWSRSARFLMKKKKASCPIQRFIRSTKLWKSKEEYEMEQERKRSKETHDKLKSSDVTYSCPGYSREAKVKESTEDIERVDDFEEIAKLSLEETNKSAREDLRPVRTPLRAMEPPLQPSESTKVKEEIKKTATGNCSKNATKEAGLEGFNISELEPHHLRQREDYLKQKRDTLMAMKKESRNNLPTPNTEEKEEALSSKEEMSEEEKQRLLVKRRMLAAKLKEEVINKR